MFIAIIVSLLTGVTLVTSRVANGKLADHTSPLTSTFYNYLVGLLLSTVVLFLLGRSELSLRMPLFSSNIWLYSGGLISVFVVFICAAVAPKVPTFYMTLLLFVGQLFASIIIDSLLTKHFSITQVVGGLFVAFGFTLTLILDKQPDSKTCAD